MEAWARPFLEAAAPLETSETRRLISGAALLATGSTLLLAWASPWWLVWLGPLIAFLFFWLGPAIAILFHLLAWIEVGRSSWAHPATRWLFVGSLVAFAVGLATLSWTLPPLWVSNSLFLIPGFPFIPTVFAPVVLFHSVLFPIASGALRSAWSLRLVWLGSGVLAAIAVVALATQYALLVTGSAPDWFWALAGLTAFGYVPVAVGIWRES